MYGIDMPFVNELIAYNKTINQICDDIGADKLIYQDLEDLILSVKKLNPKIKLFDTSCFDGKYITDGVSQDYLNQLSKHRKNKVK